MTLWHALGATAALACGALLARFLGAVRRERARELFRLQQGLLHARFLEAARGSGVPRGLTWVGCEWSADWLLARERRSRALVALQAVTVSFEAEPGGDMEGLPMVPHPRLATAVFRLERGHWVAGGRAVFNHTPAEVLEKFAAGYVRAG